MVGDAQEILKWLSTQRSKRARLTNGLQISMIERHWHPRKLIVGSAFNLRPIPCFRALMDAQHLEFSTEPSLIGRNFSHTSHPNLLRFRVHPASKSRCCIMQHSCVSAYIPCLKPFFNVKVHCKKRFFIFTLNLVLNQRVTFLKLAKTPSFCGNFVIVNTSRSCCHRCGAVFRHRKRFVFERGYLHFPRAL